MKYSPSFFRDGLPDWKRKKDPPLTRVFYRPISFVLSSFFSEIGFTANTVSYLSCLVVLIACACFVVVLPIFGAVFINIWLLLDCADGNIARCIKKEHYGDFADSMSSYICVGLMFACMGYCTCITGGALFESNDVRIILIGALAGSSDSLMRLLYQKYLNSSYAQGIAVKRKENPEEESGINRIRMNVDQWISLGGFLPLAVLLASIFSCLDVVVVLWAVYYGATFILSAFYLSILTVRANASSSENFRGKPL